MHTSSPSVPASLRRIASALALALAFSFASSATLAASFPASTPEKERELIGVLQSGAPTADKAITCKLLAIHGTAASVPTLAPLLADPELASWARIALEAIPGPEVDQALRDALPKLQGRLLIGAINSLGNRRDPQAVAPLRARLTDANPDVACAAATALGRIGTPAAAKALTQALPQASPPTRGSIAEGLILCAERRLAENKPGAAIPLYDRVRKAEVAKQRQLEATRGAILARKASGLALLLEQLHSADPDFRAIGLRTARELPGPKVTQALANEIPKANPDHQAQLVLVLADRGGDTVLPPVSEAARTGDKKVRLAAITYLEHLNQAAGVPLLIDLASDPDADLSRQAKASLARLPTGNADAAILERLPQSTGRTRQALFELASQRRLSQALPAMVQSTKDTNPAVRTAALEGLASLGQDAQVGDLVRLMEATRETKDRAVVEKALLSLSGRRTSGSVPHLVPLTQSPNPDLRQIALHALAAAGGSEALKAVQAAVADPDEAVQDEAVRTLSTWANNWPEDQAIAAPLLQLAKSGRKPSHQVLALRGYLGYLQGDKNVSDDTKVQRIQEIQTLLQRPEEKRAAISVLGSIPTAAALNQLLAAAADPAMAEEAYAAVVNVAGRKELPPAVRPTATLALKEVLERTKADPTRNKATETLKRLQ